MASSIGKGYVPHFFGVTIFGIAIYGMCYYAAWTKAEARTLEQSQSTEGTTAINRPNSVDKLSTSNARMKQSNTNYSTIIISKPMKPTNNNQLLNSSQSRDTPKTVKKLLQAATLLQIFYENRTTSKAKVHKCKNNYLVRVVQSGDLNMLQNEADAVLFNMQYNQLISASAMKKLMDISKEKEAKNISHVWIYRTQESAFFVRTSQAYVINLPIHSMAGYYLASGVHWLYGHYAPGKPMPGYEDANTAEKTLSALMKRKTKLAMWVSSHCRIKNWPRMEFVESIQDHMTVERFGGCGNQSCLPRLSPTCLVEVFQKFKFMFGFENSECDDYITEKMWNPLIDGIVPVVYGPRKASYIQQAPPNSFIYATDFNSSKELADYLLYLDKNPKEYLKYFEWRSKGTAKRGNHASVNTYCNIPELLRQVSEGKLKKQPMFQTPFFNSCKPRKEHLLSKYGYLNLTDWEPWK